MLIVCTQDAAIINWTQQAASNSVLWGNVQYLAVGQTQVQATNQLAGFLANLSNNEPLCLSAHGNDTEIGDAGTGPNDWGWTTNAIAGLLQANAANNQGPMLMRVCCETVANFSAGLAVALENIQALNLVWIYGYNRPVPITQVYPAPGNLGNQVDLQGTQVHY